MATKMKPAPKPTVSMPSAGKSPKPTIRAKRYADGGEVQMSFKEKFAKERALGNKTFEWNGKKYTTDVAKPKVSDFGSFQARDKAEGSRQADIADVKSRADREESKLSDMQGALKTAPAGAGRKALEDSVSRQKTEAAIARTAAGPSARQEKEATMRKALADAPAGQGRQQLAKLLSEGKYAKGGLVKPKGTAMKGMGAKKPPVAKAMKGDMKNMAIGKAKGKTDMGMMKAMKGKPTGMACGGMAKKGKK